MVKKIIFLYFSLFVIVYILYITPKHSTYWEFRENHYYKQLFARKRALPYFVANEKTVYDLFEPDFDCLSKTRIGATYYGDGPKFMCDVENIPTVGDCVVYSIGSDGDFSFERAIYNRFKCKIHTFDHTGEWSELARLAHSTFHKFGLGYGPDLKPLASLLKHSHVDVLKVDCEGCEWTVFDQIWKDLKEGKYYIGQILIELHHLNFKNVSNFFRGAEESGFYIFSKERNHWGCEGYKCVEYSLIHKKEAKRSHDLMFN